MLEELKKYFGIVEQPTIFDDQILIFANFVISKLPNTYKDLDWVIYPDNVRELIRLKTKILFDPPESITELESINKEIVELEGAI